MHLSNLISFSLLYSTSTLAFAIQPRQNSPTIGAPVTALPGISCLSKDDTCPSNTGGKDCDDAINENCNQAALKYPGSQDQLSDNIKTTVRSCALSFTRGSLPFVGDQSYDTRPGANLTATTYAACANEFQAILNSCNTPGHTGGYINEGTLSNHGKPNNDIDTTKPIFTIGSANCNTAAKIGVGIPNFETAGNPIGE